MQDKDLTKMYRNNHGFTLIEIIAVLVLMSIIATGVLVRSINTDQIDLTAQVAKIRNHIRYAQAMAMKRSEIWGINCVAEEYWLFQDSTSDQVQLPGEQVDTISLADFGVSIKDDFSVYFDKYGRPYISYSDTPVSVDNPLPITISGESGSVTLSVTPETGLIK
jgi:prepilin-type N-terminal cleavage/methylation domain-containing protein